MTMQTVRIEDLKAYPNNARTHSKRQIREIAASIQRFGFCNPVLIDESNQIIAGHGRVKAAQSLGMAEIPVVRISHLDAVAKRAYILADNKLALKAGWDREILAIELQSLANEGFEIEITGFQTSEVDVLLDEVHDASDDPALEDQTPDLRPLAVTRPGDLWELGSHRLVCGDARDDEVYRTVLGGEKAQFVFTDPPFNVKIHGHVSGKGRIRHREFAMGSGEMTGPDFEQFLSDVFERLVAHSTDGSIHDICMDWRHIGEMHRAGSKCYSEMKNLCVWNKTNAGMGSFYRSKHELIFVWKNGTACHINNFELGQHGRNRTNVWDYAGVNAFSSSRQDDLAMHPTVKPVRLVADAIRDCSNRNGLILDPFCGSGTVLIASEVTRRKARALEIDPAYCDVAIRRWQDFSGKCAVHTATGQTFEDCEETRAKSLQPVS